MKYQLEEARRLAEQEQNEYDDLCEWLNDALNTLAVIDRPVEDRDQEYQVNTGASHDR